jgi:hypothetical protein
VKLASLSADAQAAVVFLFIFHFLFSIFHFLFNAQHADLKTSAGRDLEIKIENGN